MKQSGLTYRESQGTIAESVLRAFNEVHPRGSLLRTLPGPRPAIAWIAGLFLAAGFALGFSSRSTSVIAPVLLIFSVVLAALEFGMLGGLIAAVPATAALFAWRRAGVSDPSLLPLLVDLIVFFGVAGAVGYVSNRMRRAYEGQRLVVEQASDAILGVDDRGRIIYANPRIESTFGYRPEELIGEPVENLIPEELGEAHRGHRALFDEAPRSRAMGNGDSLWARRKDGRVFPVDVSLAPVETADGLIVMSFIRDLLERRTADAELRIREQQFRGVFEGALDAMLIADDERRYVDANPAACVLLGRSREEILGLRIDDVSSVTDVPETWSGFVVEGGMKGEYELIRPDGERRKVEFSATASFLPGRHLSVIRDVTERKQAEEHVTYLAYHDEITALPNRAMFAEHLDLALARAGRRDQALAVLHLGLDRFKLVNDALGHATGDELLRMVGERILGSARAGDLVARHPGDEFLLLIGDLESDEAESVALESAERIHEVLTGSFRIEGQEIFLAASVGVSTFPVDAKSGEELLRNADLAMSEVKRGGRGGTRLHDPSTTKHGFDISLSGPLRHAIECHELVLHYQPIVDLESRRVFGAEALIRWQRPGHGLIMPDQFIPLAEDTGLISKISDWVVGEVARQLRAWADAGLDLCVSCNLSARDFRDPELVARIDRKIAEASADPGRLTVELTETTIVDDPTRTREVLSVLGERGIHVAIDDFGFGHSSIGLLRELTSAHALKIDRSVVRDVTTDQVARTIVDGIITIAGGLGLAVLAEGIETEAERHQLVMQGCRLGQGFYFSRPVPAAEIPALVSTPSEDDPAGDCANMLFDATPL